MRKVRRVSIICTLFAATVCSVINSLGAEIRVPSEHATIQAALDNAVSGDTIRLAAGDYYEQFMLAGISNVTILGDSGTILHASDEMTVPPLPFQGMSYPIAAVVDGAEATFRNLEFRGHRLSDVFPESLIGIVFRGGSGRVEDCTFTGFRGDSEKDGRAINVQNDIQDQNDIAYIAILNSSFSDNKSSILLFGGSSVPNTLRTTFTLTSNRVSGAQNIASTGIGIRPGVEGVLRENVIADHSADLGVVANDADFSSRGFFHPLRHIVCADNIFSNNAVHFSAISARDIVVTNNIFVEKHRAYVTGLLPSREPTSCSRGTTSRMHR